MRSDIEGHSSARVRESLVCRIVFIGPFRERFSGVISTRCGRDPRGPFSLSGPFAAFRGSALSDRGGLVSAEDQIAACAHIASELMLSKSRSPLTPDNPRLVNEVGAQTHSVLAAWTARSRKDLRLWGSCVVDREAGESKFPSAVLPLPAC